MTAQLQLMIHVFWIFFKIGPVTFGGGYAMIPLIEREVVTRKKWLKLDDVSDIFALAESVPGAIAINSATFIGHRVAGVLGALAAMIGVLMPTFLIVLLLTTLLILLQGNAYVDAFFTGIRPAIVALIVFAAIKIGRTAILDKTTFLLMLVMLVVLLVTPIHPILIIGSGAVIGILIIKIKEKLGLVPKQSENERVKEDVHAS